MFRGKNNNRKVVGSKKAFKRAAAMLDIIALVSSLIFILAACATAKPESGTPDTSPVESDSQLVTEESPADVTIPSEASYHENTLTARGLRRGDTVEKLLETYDDNLLYVPEPFPISRDFSGDFCVYDELFVYTREEDNNGCIVFYVADAIDSKFITGIRISREQDGGPEYFADGVNTFAVDYENLNQYLKTDTSDEEKVHELLDRLQHAQGPGKIGDDITVTDVLEAMTDINWRIYSQLYTTDAFDALDALDALDWLYRQKLTSTHDILCVLKATKGLDGAYSETYSGILANIYRNDNRGFIRLASQLDSSQIDNITQLICYDLSLDKDIVIPQLEGYQKSGELTDMEQLIVSDILRCFALWYVD